MEIDKSIKVKTWDDMKKKYPVYRDELSKENEKEFVNECFMLYEQEGFSKIFWSQGGDFEEYIEKSFEVTGRSTEVDTDLRCLPMWNIKFKNGAEISAYPDEIIPREMIENGCKLKLV